MWYSKCHAVFGIAVSVVSQKTAVFSKKVSQTPSVVLKKTANAQLCSFEDPRGLQNPLRGLQCFEEPKQNALIDFQTFF